MKQFRQFCFLMISFSFTFSSLPAQEQQSVDEPSLTLEEEDSLKARADNIEESPDQQVLDPFIPRRFADERSLYSYAAVITVSIALFAGGLLAVNAHRGVNPGAS